MKKKQVMDALISLETLFLALIVVFPIIYCVCGAFKGTEEYTAYPPRVLPNSFANLENFQSVFVKIPLLRYCLNSLVVGLLSAGVRIGAAVLAAYAFAFYDFRGKKALFFLLLGTMMLPADTLVVTNYQTISRLGLLDTYLGMAAVSFVGASQMFMLRQQFLSAPLPLREAALLDGCGDLRFLWSVLLPVSYPVLLTLLAQAFVNSWNAYLWPLLVTNRADMRTIQVGLAMLSSVEDNNYFQTLAGATLALIPALILFYFLRKSFARAITSGATTG